MDFAQGLNSIETFYGMVETTSDAFRVFDLCRRGKLGRIRRRLHDRERRLIRSGSIFCFDEAESGIRRWTDGRLWSPSRILGNFLIYRELDRKVTSGGVLEESNANYGISNPLLSNMVLVDKELSWLEQPVLGSTSILSASVTEEEELPSTIGISPLSVFGNTGPDQSSFPSLTLGNSSSSPPNGNGGDRKDRLEASWKSMASSTNLMDSRLTLKPSAYQFKAEGLIKKTISARVDGRLQHLVCYYSKQDFCEPAGSALQRLPQMAELRAWPVPIDLMIAQNFRKPPLADEPHGLTPVPQQLLAQPSPCPVAAAIPAAGERRKRRNTAPVSSSASALGKHSLLEDSYLVHDCNALQLSPIDYSQEQGEKELMELVGITQPSSEALIMPSVFHEDAMLTPNPTTSDDAIKTDSQFDQDFLNSLKVSVDDNSIFL